MKRSFQIISDIHLEFLSTEQMPIIEKLADNLILAGDIGLPHNFMYKKFLLQMSRTFDNVYLITGNHEYYSDGKHIEHMEQIDKNIKNLVSEFRNVHFLQRESILFERNDTYWDGKPVIAGSAMEDSSHVTLEYIDNSPKELSATEESSSQDLLCEEHNSQDSSCDDDSTVNIFTFTSKDIKPLRIIGATLWTHIPEHLYTGIESNMSDYMKIRTKKDKGEKVKHVSPKFISELHAKDVEFITSEIKKAKENGEDVIVITHHAPSFKSVHEKFQGDHINVAYASHLDHLLTEPVKVWVHGHMHDATHYYVGNCMVICNPVGYPSEKKDFEDVVIEL